MKNLFLIDGTSGSGKSDLIEFVFDFRHNIALVPKYTTREIRDYEISQKRLLDLNFVSDDEFNSLELDYTYPYGGKRYGFSRDALFRCLEERDNVFVIVRNADRIKRLKAEFDFINVVAVFVHTDEDKARVRMKHEKLTEIQIDFRLARAEEAFEDYVMNSGLYDEVIINNSDRATYHRLADQLLQKYSTMPDVEDDLVFVLMSFDTDNEALKDYYMAMQRAVARIDDRIRCLNLDDVSPGSPRISDTAKAKIRNCRLTIVDLTGNRPNVFYELGYVHGIRKPCVITAQKGTPPMFYPAEYRVLYYANATELEEKLENHLRGILNP